MRCYIRTLLCSFMEKKNCGNKGEKKISIKNQSNQTVVSTFRCCSDENTTAKELREEAHSWLMVPESMTVEQRQRAAGKASMKQRPYWEWWAA